MMKKITLKLIVFALLTMIFATVVIQAEPELIGISNVTNGTEKSGVFEIRGVILNNGQIGRVAVKAGVGPWEDACGVDRWSYQLNSRQIVLGYANPGEPETAIRGPFYGDLSIVIGAFDNNNHQVAEKTVHVTIVPEKPYSDIVSGEYSEPLNVALKAAPEVTTYYTTDGTDPKINGVIYTGIVFVNQNTIIKAVAKSNNNQYSEITILDLKINPRPLPWFQIQYYEDQAMRCPVPEPAYLKAGTYYLKVMSDRKYSGAPRLDIDAPGNGNDVLGASLVPVSDCVFQFTRVIQSDYAATGDTQETMRISGIDSHGNPVSDVIPANLVQNAAYPDTQPPTTGSVALTGGISVTNDPTPKLEINSTGAAWMRLSLSEAALSAAPWVEYSAQYDDFVISSGGTGNKTIWIEFKDQAGNIQTQHASINANYDNTVLTFDIEYFGDFGLTQSLGNNPYLKEGTYYLKITANQDLGYIPTVQIDAEGTNNDVISGLTTMLNPRLYYYTRTITADNSAAGQTKEQVAIQGINPSNLNSKGAYTDTQAPGVPVVSGPATTDNPKPTWTWNNVTGATRYRYSFSGDSNWVETTGASFTPAENLIPGARYTLYVQAGDKAGNWSQNGSFSTLVAAPEMNVKQWNAIDIPSGTGSCDFGNVTLFRNKQISFTIENTGSGDLNLTGTPVVRIDGPGAASFRVINQPSPLVSSYDSISFAIAFTPTDTETKNATVSIANNDTDENPYAFTVTGTGVINGILTLDTWSPGNISTAGDVNTFRFNAVPGKIYTIAWDDSHQGSGTYTGDVKVSAYRQDLTTPYFSNLDVGYTIPQVITAQDTVIYVKIVSYQASTTGSFAVKVGDILPEPVIVLKQGTTNIPNGGSYNFGNVALSSSANASFTIQNSGGINLNLTGDPKVQISGADASNFTVTVQSSSLVAPFLSTYFTVRFTPTSPGAKTATISIANNDADNDPYTFTITGTGTGLLEPLALGAWNTGYISAGEIKVYSFNATIGSAYMITWDDSAQGSGTYNGNVRVSAYRQNFITSYFSGIDSGYNPPKIITAQESSVNLRIEGITASSTGSFALKVSEIIPEPIMNLKQGATNIPNGTGNYSFGSLNMGSSKTVTFTIENKGTGNIELSSPRVQISGADASAFNVTVQPFNPVEPYTSTNFSIKFTPTSSGTKTATVSIVNNDSDQNPYTFTITGSGVASPLNNWIIGNISTPGEEKIYGFNVSAGSTYRITWDDDAGGTDTYTGNTRVTGYRQDLATPYFTDAAMGYAFPKTIIAQDNVVIIKVRGFNNSTGSYALKVFLYEPTMSVQQGTTDIPSGTGVYDFGNAGIGSSKSFTFAIRNTGNADLNLTGASKIGISGTDASCFCVTSNPYSPISPNGSANFVIRFTPNSPEIKTATVSITNNDSDQNPYTFTVRGTGTGTLETLPFDTWTPGNIAAAGEEKCYSFNAVVGQDYCIGWDEPYQGSGAFTCDIRVSAFRQDFTTAYFTDIDSGYTIPRTITALENVIYLKVRAYGSETGSYALKVYPAAPRINLKQGTDNVPNGTGSYNFGDALLCTTGYLSFTIENLGIGDLRLTGSGSGIQISGPDASSFYISTLPSTTIGPNQTTSFVVGFKATSRETKTATITITSTDTNNNSPYTFTVTGTGIGEFEPLSLDTLKTGSLSPNEVKLYSFSATPGKTYAVTWDDYSGGSGTYSGDIYVTAFRQDMATTYFESDNGFWSSPIITAQENIVYLKVAGYSSSSSGTFSLKVFVPQNEATINVSQGDVEIPNGTGSYDFGNVSLLTSRNATFRIQNTGIPDLQLNGSPIVQISGAGASHFSVTSPPFSQLGACQSATFTIKFTPDGTQTRTATVSIMSDDADRTPYTFTISGTGSVTELTLNTWTEGNISVNNEEKTYCFNVIPGKPYGISWQDRWTSPAHTGRVKVTAYRTDLTATYFNDVMITYPTPQYIIAQDNIVYLKVTGIFTGSYALKPFLDESAMNLKQGTTVIPNGGNYDCGNVAIGPGNSVSFTIENTGSGNLNLTGTPKVWISGADAASFRVLTDPPGTVEANESATFNIGCEPTSIGTKTATVSIANNDPAGNPYTFTITGTGTMEGTLAFDTWTTGNISPGERKTYCLNFTSGRTYAITWDDSGNGSGTYTGDVLVSAYRQDFTGSYFSQDHGYDTNQAKFSAQDNLVYITVLGNTAGSFALKAYIYEPVMTVQQETTLIPNGSWNFDFGDVSILSRRKDYFAIYNQGNAPLVLTDYQYVHISGPDADCFSVPDAPYQYIYPSKSSGFTIQFNPTSAGPKTATITINSNDPDQSPFTFTVSGNGTGSFIPLTFDNWTPGTVPEMDIYSFQATPGTAYAIRCDDGNSGSGAYYGNAWVDAYRKDTLTSYFRGEDIGYTYPKVIIAQDDIVYVSVYGSGASYALMVSLSEPVIDVKRDSADIPSGTGSYNYGPVSINSNQNAYFTLKNIGDGALHLTGNPPVQITGPDASSFEIMYQPSSPIEINDSRSLNVRFAPTSLGTKTATIIITSDDLTHNPYTFTVTGYGSPVIEKTLIFNSWTEGNIATAGGEKYYSFTNATVGKKYAIVWDDSGQGSGIYTADVKVTAYRGDFLTPYFTDINNGYAPPQFVTAEDATIYIKVAGLDSSSTGSFNLKIAEPLINLKVGSTDIPNGSGSYDFGSVALDSNNSATFTIQNIGSVILNLTGSPKVQISGADASCFSVTTQPYSPVGPGSGRTFTITFTPSGIGTKTAMVSIGSDDPYSNPYTFTVTGTVAAESLAFDTWTPGNISAGEVKTYYFSTNPGTVYAIAWDDSVQGSGTYTGDIKVSAYRQDYTTAYFSNVDSGYAPCRTITALESIVYVKVAGYTSSSTGSFALKPSLSIPEIKLKQGSMNIPNGTGSYNYGNVSIDSNSSVTFTLQNTGTGILNLTGSPKVEISGADAALFSVTAEPASPVAISDSTTFTVRFAPTTIGSKTATISITSDDATNSPYTFTITGTGIPTGIALTLGGWTPGNIATAGEVKTYNFTATPGTVYAIAWDDSYSGTGSYTCDIKVSAYRQDLTTAYFSNVDSGYTSPRTITALDDVVYIKVAGYSSGSTGSFALKPSLSQPAINVKQGTTNIPNTTGNYDFGNVAPGSSSSINFTIQNTGNDSLSLTGSPRVQISGAEASLFTVTAQPSSSVAVNGSATFTLQFAPITLGAKNATVSIASNDPENSVYTFTVTGTGANSGEELTLGSFIPKSLTAGETKTYWFSAIPGRTYRIYWDDSYQGSGTYSCDIKVSSYRQNLSTTYFGYTDSAYITPQTITAQENVVYLKVAGYYSNSSGTFALKVVEI